MDARSSLPSRFTQAVCNPLASSSTGDHRIADGRDVWPQEEGTSCWKKDAQAQRRVYAAQGIGAELSPTFDSRATGIRALMRGSKDAALSFAARSVINARLRTIGEVTDLSLDTASRSLRLRVTLLGESEPVDIHVRHYDIHRSGDSVMLTLVDASASREWLTAALDEFVVGRPLSISRKAGLAVRLLG
jgi:hypothetical protein